MSSIVETIDLRADQGYASPDGDDGGPVGVQLTCQIDDACRGSI